MALFKSCVVINTTCIGRLPIFFFLKLAELEMKFFMLVVVILNALQILTFLLLSIRFLAFLTLNKLNNCIRT